MLRFINGLTGCILMAVSAIASAQTAPAVFRVYTPPANLAQDAGEPSLDITKTGKVMFQASLNTYKVSFDDAAASSTWQDVSSLYTSLTSLDPILTGDLQTGRIFVSQLLTATSLMAYSDNEGASWTPTQGAGILSGIDHQTLASGPYPKTGLGATLARPILAYPNAVYYCSQTLVDGFCSRSDDGGLTFGLSIPTFKLGCSGGLHGHVKVAPDGTVYLPHKSCGSNPGVAVSEDAGTTWTVRKVPTGIAGGDADPSIGIAKDGTAYLSWVDANGHPKVASSKDKGKTWTAAFDLGTAVGVQNAVFPAAVAGDGDRAAVAFHGTSTGGNFQGLNFPGKWYLYIATTYDGGNTWAVTNATPNDPTQGAGGICTSGTTCGSNRNLLDFMDLVVDATGRLHVGYADGCIGACVTGGANTFASRGSIARQVGGTLLVR